MPYFDHLHTDAISPTRALALSLLWEALYGPRPPTPPLPRPARRRAGGHPVYWTRARILETCGAYVARYGRLPKSAAWQHATEAGLPSLYIVRRHCGSLEALREALRQEGPTP